MPTYEFRCEDCKRVFTLVMSMAERDKGKVSCPTCKKKNVKQQISTFPDEDEPQELEGSARTRCRSYGIIPFSRR